MNLEESRVYREAKENLLLSVLEDLSEAFLNFSSRDDLSAWLEAHRE
ncbi:DUF4351 domain-containing protein [Floridanema evergladense]|uniref:DUF4351 domain-containing protein n=1 Tax=Floridaenema evergladense BLCC-F167 TaxID=3153639 RepID=A0ABV4WUR2_9CYAN